jgi:hypothetical protein
MGGEGGQYVLICFISSSKKVLFVGYYVKDL